jgi:NAD(P)-dependent dehydrogenase (short-subunit alcohol dehydrogenase family)
MALVFIGSMYNERPQQQQHCYKDSKAGVIMLGKSLAADGSS